MKRCMLLIKKTKTNQNKNPKSFSLASCEGNAFGCVFQKRTTGYKNHGWAKSVLTMVG